MTGNTPSNDDRQQNSGPKRDLGMDGIDGVSLPPVPQGAQEGVRDSQRPDPHGQLLFDQKLRQFGEAIKEELIQNTKQNIFGEYKWEPYQLTIDHIPKEYHDRLAHYLLQAYGLPYAEQHVSYNVPVFVDLDRTALAAALFERGRYGADAIAQNLYNFKGVDERYLIKKLFRDADKSLWIPKVDFFVTVSHESIASRLLNDRFLRSYVSENLDKFRPSKELNKHIVKSAFKDRRAATIFGDDHVDNVPGMINVLHTLTDVNHGKVLLKAVGWSEAGAEAVAANLHRFPQVDCQALANECEKRWKSWGGWGDRERAMGLASFFAEFPRLSQEERERRLLQIDPYHVLPHIREYPSISHLEAALAFLGANEHTIFPSNIFPSLGSLADMPPDEQRILVDAIIRDEGTPTGLLLQNYAMFSGIEPSVLVDKIIDLEPLWFLQTGAFAGFTPAEILERLIEKRGIPSDDNVALPESEIAASRWLRFGGHTRKTAAEYLKAGEGRLVVRNIDCFVGLTTSDLREAAMQTAVWLIGHGRVDSASYFVQKYEVSLGELNEQLVGQLAVDFALNDQSPPAILRRAGVAAWSLYSPDVLETPFLRKRPDLVLPLRRMFGPTDSAQLAKNNHQYLLENLVSRGVPLLIHLGWLRPDTIESLAAILPSFLESTTGSVHAWRVHEINLRATHNRIEAQRRESFSLRKARKKLGESADPRALAKEALHIRLHLEKPPEETPASWRERLSLMWQKLRGGGEVRENETSPFSGRQADPLRELTLLRQFYQDFGVIQAPELYFKRYRVDGMTLPSDASGLRRMLDVVPRTLMKLWQNTEDLFGAAWPARLRAPRQGPVRTPELSALQHELRCLHSDFARERPPYEDQINREHIEYAAAWMRMKRPREKLDGVWDKTVKASVSIVTWEDPLELLEKTLGSSDFDVSGRQPKNPALLTRRIAVHVRSELSARQARWTHSLPVHYERLRERLEQLKGSRADTVFSHELSSVRSLLEEQLKGRRQRAEQEESASPRSPKASQLRKQVAHIEECLVALETVEDAPRLIELLSRIGRRSSISEDALKASIVTLALTLGLERVYDPEEFLASLESPPSEGSVRRMVEFLANEVRDGGLRLLESDRKVLHTAEKYLSLPDLTTALVQVRAAEGDNRSAARSVETKELLVLPTRGVLAELAGYFSDACWTDDMNLMREHPHATALIFLERERPTSDEELSSDSVDLSDAKLLGACYILQVKDMSGNDVLVLRGVNPRERVIERLDVESFIEQLLDEVLVPYAKALGVSKVVVPFDDLGHAQTNRQLISEYFHRRYGDSEYVPLDPKGPKSDFHGRLIFDKCRLLRPQPPAREL